MRVLKYLLALWVGTVVYVLASLSSGAMGSSAYRQLEAELDKEKANIEILRNINQDLENTKNALLYDKDTLAVFAREQGFARKDERFIRVVGLGSAHQNKNTPGVVITAIPPEHTPERFIRIFSLCAGLSVLICLGAYDFLMFLREKN
jgi:cell division protein FtsB